MGCSCSSEPPSPKSLPLEYQKIDSIWNVVKYRRKLGVGGSAQVCLVSSLDTEELYALKMMGHEYHPLFLKEVRMLKILDCPQIVRFQGAYKDSQSDYILMEYCAGDSLIRRIAEMKKYTEGMAASTAKMMLFALKYLHDKDIVHRDIKPENFVYLTKMDKTLKLIDFGIAMDAIPAKSYTWHAGTPYYMAPEVVKNTDPRSGDICKKGDMWSLGVCLFIMLNGEAPFKGASKEAVFDNILAQSKIKFSTPGISDDAKDFVLKLLQRDPQERMTVDEALKHHWVVSCGKNENEIIASTVDALRFFNARRTVHRALHRVAVENLNEYDELYYRALFNQFDSNGDGNISREECIAALELNNIYAKEAERLVNEFFEKADLNHDNMIQYDEFKTAMVKKGLTYDEYRIHAVFTALDVNHDGKISVDEFTSCLAQGDDEEISQIVEAFSEADENKDNELSFQEFAKIINYSPRRRATTFKLLEPQEMDRVIDVDEQYRSSVGATTVEEAKLDIVDSYNKAEKPMT